MSTTTSMASPIPTPRPKATVTGVSPIVSHPLLIAEWHHDNGEAQLIGANPLKTDPELKRLLAELPDIDSRRAFGRWRTSFLTRYEFFLEQSGTGQAEPAYQAFCRELDKLHTLTVQVQEHVQNTPRDPHCRNDDDEPTFQVTVSTRRRLAEWNKQLGRMSLALSSLTPATLEVETLCGYTKFQLGALLVRNGFSQYHSLAECEEACEQLRDRDSTTGSCLPYIADRQVLESMQEYQTKLAIFCDIMADLGLYQAMLKCHEINQLPKEEEPEEEEEIVEIVEEEEEEEIEETPPPPQPKKEKKKKTKKTEEPKKPFTFSLSFPALKPPSGPFIKYVDTGAKTEEQVTKGIHPRGKLQGEGSSHHDHSNGSGGGSGGEDGFDQEWDGPIKFDPKGEEEAYKPVPKMQFTYGYHGGKNTDAWRIQNAKNNTNTSSNLAAGKKKKVGSTSNAAAKQDDDDSSTSSYGHLNGDNDDSSSSSSNHQQSSDEEP
ncbi:hypothetical protein ACA910_010078 [Epithemia clementina (nom. ined.)]